MLNDVSDLAVEKGGRGHQVGPTKAVPQPRSTFSAAVGFGDGRQSAADLQQLISGCLGIAGSTFSGPMCAQRVLSDKQLH